MQTIQDDGVILNIILQVRAVVRRSAGTYGHVTVRLRTVGGGEAWDEQIALLARSDSNNTISEALSNRDTRQAAAAAADYQVCCHVNDHFE